MAEQHQAYSEGTKSLDEQQVDLSLHGSFLPYEGYLRFGGLDIESDNDNHVVLTSPEGKRLNIYSEEDPFELTLTVRVTDECSNEVYQKIDSTYHSGSGDAVEDYIGRSRMESLLNGFTIDPFVDNLLAPGLAILFGPALGFSVLLIKEAIKAYVRHHNSQIRGWINDHRVRGIRLTTHVSGGSHTLTLELL